jgi:hypothetical protein
MTFILSELAHIINTLDDSLFMSEIQSKINVSAGYDKDEDDNEEAFVQMSFHLKNGSAEIKLCDSTGVFSYLDCDEKKLKSIEFDDSCVTEINGSFRKALKQIWAFDRQHVGKVKESNLAVDRASFGLAEVN